MQEIPVRFLGLEDPWRRDRLLTPVYLGFPCGSAGKESSCNAGGLGLIPGLGRPPRGGKGYPLQYSGLENSMDSIVCGVAKSRTQLSDFHLHFHQWLSHGSEICNMTARHPWEREPCPWAAGLSEGEPYLQERDSGHGGRAGIEVKASPGKAQTFPAEHLRVWRKDLKEWWTKNEKQIRSIKLKWSSVHNLMRTQELGPQGCLSWFENIKKNAF